jgi:hypothetical protein
MSPGQVGDFLKERSVDEDTKGKEYLFTRST